jgi:hypothetical protein
MFHLHLGQCVSEQRPGYSNQHVPAVEVNPHMSCRDGQSSLFPISRLLMAVNVMASMSSNHKPQLMQHFIASPLRTDEMVT